MRLPQDRILHIGTELKDGKVNIVAEWQGELVRCKECRKGIWKTTDEDELIFCRVFQKWFAETFYCADGERREPLPQYEEWQDEFNKMCESARPKSFVADEWYRDTFKGEEE